MKLFGLDQWFLTLFFQMDSSMEINKATAVIFLQKTGIFV